MSPQFLRILQKVNALPEDEQERLAQLVLNEIQLFQERENTQSSLLSTKLLCPLFEEDEVPFKRDSSIGRDVDL